MKSQISKLEENPLAQILKTEKMLSIYFFFPHDKWKNEPAGFYQQGGIWESKEATWEEQSYGLSSDLFWSCHAT